MVEAAVRRSFLVTGGAGFIGSHLCDRLLAEETTERVVCVDNLQTGNTANIAEALKDPRFEFVEEDIRLPLEIDGPIDGVFHLASPASPPAYMDDPVGTLLTGSRGTYNVASFAREHGARIVYSSTSEVYGDPLQHPQPEGYWGNVNPVGPRSCYDEGKRFGESLLCAMADTHGLDIGIIRIFNTYGPRMHPQDGRIISTFVDQALDGRDITVFGSGEQTRSFCFVDDLVEGFMRMMASTARGPINMGNPQERTVLEMAETIREVTGSKSRIVFRPLPQDDPVRRRPVIDKAWETLGWRPTVDLADGLRRCIGWHVERRAAEAANAVADGAADGDHAVEMAG